MFILTINFSCPINPRKFAEEKLTISLPSIVVWVPAALQRIRI